MPRRRLCFGRKVGMEPGSSHVSGLLRARAVPVRQKRKAIKRSRRYGEKEENEKEVERERERNSQVEEMGELGRNCEEVNPSNTEMQ